MNRFEDITPEARQAFGLSTEIMGRYGHNQVDTEHLLLALIEQPNSIVSNVLKVLNTDTKALADQLDKRLSSLPAPIFGGSRGQVFIHPRIKNIIDRAYEEAVKMHDNAIATGHIFLAILLEGNTPSVHLLGSVLLTHEQIYETIQNIRLLSDIPENLNILQHRQQSSDVQSIQVFLCHSSDDKPKIRELFHRLLKDGFTPWLDEVNLLPGQDWQIEIPKAVRNSDVVIVCLSTGSINKTGYVQKEIRQALDVADEQPEGTVFIIPLKLEECNVPERLKRWQWVNLFDENGYERLMVSLKIRAETKKK